VDAELRRRLAAIRILMMDVDGVLTDGGLYYSESGEQMKRFFVRDGLGIKLIQRAGIATAFVTGLKSELVAERARELGVGEVIQDCMDKEPEVKEILKLRKLAWEEVAYVGDDLIDLQVMRSVGFAVAVADAPEAVKKVAHYVTTLPGGRGAVREVCDLILSSRGAAESPDSK